MSSAHSISRIVVLDGHTACPGGEDPLDALSWAPLSSLAPSFTVHPRTPASETVARCAGADVVLTNKAPLSREALTALRPLGLKYVGVLATGHNIVDSAAARELGIVVANVPGYSTMSVAQHALALLMELSNHVGAAAADVRGGGWARCPDFSYWAAPTHELAGRTLGILGFGEIGSALGRVCAALGMRVLAHKRAWAAPPPPGVEVAASLEDLLARADVLSLHCPLTDATRHVIDARALAAMKRTALLINTSRGPLVDEAALARALNEGVIAGAALDVLSQEPPAPDNPLLAAKNCIVTPHVAWASVQARQRLLECAAKNVAAFAGGEPTNVVNK
jgi:glycerate dehydrogenase